MILGKGQATDLFYTQTGRERILVALSWDEKSDKISLLDKLRGAHHQHDLDIACFVFDKDGAYTDFVGAMAQDAVDSTGAIYHSGDDMTGEGLGDDESISLELAGLDPATKDIFFVVEIRSDHSFAEISHPTVRIADGMTDKDILRAPLGTGENGAAQACVFARLSRDSHSATGWALHYLDEYPDLSDVSDWASYLKRHI